MDYSRLINLNRLVTLASDGNPPDTDKLFQHPFAVNLKLGTL